MGAGIPVTDQSVKALEQCIESGGVAIMPTDTLYGLACDPTNWKAAERLYELKGRPEQKPSAVMFFALSNALKELSWLDRWQRSAVEALLPGPVTAVVPNPTGVFGPACGGGPLGVRVPDLKGGLEPLTRLSVPVLQSSANLAGGESPRSLDQIPSEIAAAVDVVLDGGELPGVGSTVVSLVDPSNVEILREGAVSGDEVRRVIQEL